MASNSRSWIDGIRRWIRRLIRREHRHPSPVILERFSFPACGVLRLERDTTGSVDTWRVIPRQGENDFLVAIDSFRRVKHQIDNEEKLRGKKLGPSPGRHTLTDEAKRLLLWQPNKVVTHLFWVQKISRFPINGRIKLECIGIWAFDLEGILSGWTGHDRYPQAICRRAVKSIASLPDPDFSINVIDPDAWLSAMTKAAKAFLGQLHQV
ncbi:hypothetical protein H6F61_26495 [Cyanobacteria bacterium FACHB-472]|nr:hypothetical protein [Cyanobacteria bacterium FACHB-472]